MMSGLPGFEEDDLIPRDCRPTCNETRTLREVSHGHYTQQPFDTGHR